MNTQHRGRAAFAVCGSFCTLGAAAAQAEQLVRQGWELLPVMSFAASRLDTRFGRALEWKERLEQLTGHPVLDSLQAGSSPSRWAVPCWPPWWCLQPSACRQKRKSESLEANTECSCQGLSYQERCHRR